MEGFIMKALLLCYIITFFNGLEEKVIRVNEYELINGNCIIADEKPICDTRCIEPCEAI